MNIPSSTPSRRNTDVGCDLPFAQAPGCPGGGRMPGDVSQPGLAGGKEKLRVQGKHTALGSGGFWGTVWGHGSSSDPGSRLAFPLWFRGPEVPDASKALWATPSLNAGLPEFCFSPCTRECCRNRPRGHSGWRRKAGLGDPPLAHCHCHRLGHQGSHPDVWPFTSVPGHASAPVT